MIENISNWLFVNLEEVISVLDHLRKPINSAERQARTLGKQPNELYPYYGATGQVGFIDDFITDGEYVLIGEDAAPFFDHTKPVAYKISGKTWVNNHAHVLKPIINQEFCLHYLNSFNYVGFVEGTTRLKLTQGALKRIPIPLPPLAEQHRIVAKIEELFSDLDKGIESLKTAKDQLKVYRQAVLKYAFEGRLTNPDVIEGELPEGWRSEVLSRLCDINPKLPFSHYKDHLEVTFLPMKRVSEVVNKIDVTEVRTFKEVKKGFTPMINGDVIFAKITPCMENGKIAVVHSLKNGVAFGSTEFHVFRCKEAVLNTFIFHYLVQERTRYTAEENMTGAVGQRRVPKKFLEDYIINIPNTVAEQQKVVQEIESRLSVCDKIEESIEQGLQQAEALRQSILKKAFEGKLVLQDPNDEPAHVLLERIKAERAAAQPIKKQKKAKA